MSDNSRLSGDQVLDEYFFDLLAEPDDEPEPEACIVDDVCVAEPPEPDGLDDIAVVDAAVVDTVEYGESTIVISDHIPREVISDHDLPEVVAESEPLEKAVVDGNITPAPSAVPFDFGTLDEQSDHDDSSESSWQIESDDAHYPAMAPLRQPPAAPLRPSWFAECQPETQQHDLQRLLSQVSQLQAKSEPAPIVASPLISDELTDEWQLVMAHEAALSPSIVVGMVEQGDTISTVIDTVSLEVNVVPETQASGSMPPDNWQQQVESDDSFQALFFEVNGVAFAVPLTELGGIHQLGEVSYLLGRPAWYLGLMTNREFQLDVVDTASWVMPDKLTSDDHREGYRYVVMLGVSKWGLACNVLQGTELLTGESVRWREKAGKRPWLAGMVKEKMCALIHVSELITMLNAGLDVNTKLRQS